jgi:N-acyl-D-amino-acid deacylase
LAADGQDRQIPLTAATKPTSGLRRPGRTYDSFGRGYCLRGEVVAMRVDLVVRDGVVVDGTGAPAYRADVAVHGDRIATVGTVNLTGDNELEAGGYVVAPGFINVLSHAYGTLQKDPRGLSDLYQGVTTEIFGEGYSLGPVAGRLVEEKVPEYPTSGVRLKWPRLNDFLGHLEAAGVGPNVASFVGADNLRMIHAGAQNRPLTEDELHAACRLLDAELAAGALGVGSALIYAPGAYASTAELAAYAEMVAKHDALYISHIRDEADRLLAALDEVVEIAQRSGARAEVYHLKAFGRRNWPLMTKALDLIDRARAEGVRLTADIYPYEAGCTVLNACIPPAFHDGGLDAMLRRLADPATRAAIKAAIATPGGDWQNLYSGAGGAEGVLLLGADADVVGRTLAEVSAERGDADPIDTLLDLVRAAPELLAAYFFVAEENIRLALGRPWVSICSDSEAPGAEPPFTASPTHPRAYGSFARVLGRYVHDGVLTLEDAVRRMTSLPAANLGLADRGRIREGAFADLAIFDPGQVRDHATYRDPHRYATGMRHVLVNGRVVFRDGRPTGTLAGRALRAAR